MIAIEVTIITNEEPTVDGLTAAKDMLKDVDELVQSQGGKVVLKEVRAA